MRNYILIVLVLFATTNVFSQKNSNKNDNCANSGLNITLESEKINSEQLLDNFINMPIYKIYLKNGDNEAIEIGPSKDDLMKIFGGKNGDKGYYCLNDLAGLNFAAIQALNEKTNNLQNTLSALEAMQNMMNGQTADFMELQNQLIELSGVIEELKQKNIELENTINDLRGEIKK